MPNEKKLSRTRALAAKVIYAALSILRENGGEMPVRDLRKLVEKQVDLDEWEKHRYEKSGCTRWETALYFYSIYCVKAGYLIKKKGVWYLTSEGEKALALGAVELLNSAAAAFRRWKSEQVTELAADIDRGTETGEGVMPLEEIEQIAMDSLKRHIERKNPYEFQDLVGALLRGMGYNTPFVAPRGKDGGLDIIAYRDPLGIESPRIRVQIKRRDSSATVQEVRQLMGLLQKEGDVGIFVSTGGFTPDAKATARSSHIHVELIDLSRFIDLWQQHYEKLTDEDKAMLPLTRVYFLASKE